MSDDKPEEQSNTENNQPEQKSESAPGAETKSGASGADFNKVAQKAGKIAKEVGFIGGKLFKDLTKSVKEIVDDYKNRPDEESSDNKAGRPAEEKKDENKPE